VNRVDLVIRLIESEDYAKLDELVVDFVDRLLLRMFSTPGLLQYLVDFRVDNDTLELVFSKLPDDALNGLLQLLGTSAKVFGFSRDGNDYHGLRVGLEKFKSGSAAPGAAQAATSAVSYNPLIGPWPS